MLRRGYIGYMDMDARMHCSDHITGTARLSTLISKLTLRDAVRLSSYSFTVMFF